MHAVVVAAGALPGRDELDRAWPGWAADVGLVVAADGGALGAEQIGLPPAVLVGDGDSAGEEALASLAAAGVELRLHPAAKDETDLELALLAALESSATRVTVLGALGGVRLDHALANVLLLAHPALAGVRVEVLDERARLSLVSAPGADGAPVVRDLPGPPGSIVSLLPLGGDAEGVVTTGFAYPLHGERLPLGPARGVSNVRSGPAPAVELGRGRLLVVELAWAGDRHRPSRQGG